MPHPDFATFQEEITWYFEPTDQLEITDGALTCSDGFIATFPLLHRLVAQARVLNIKRQWDGETAYYKLLSWTNVEGTTNGWLCRFEAGDPSTPLLPEHLLLLDSLGGIEENYYQIEPDPEEDVDLKLTDNQNFVFTKSACRADLDGWLEPYQEQCAEIRIIPLDTSTLVCFAQGANGDETFYDLHTKRVLRYSHDHSPGEGLTPVAGQPAGTFFTIDGVVTFVDYVETLARQWLDMLPDA